MPTMNAVTVLLAYAATLSWLAPPVLAPVPVPVPVLVPVLAPPRPMASVL